MLFLLAIIGGILISLVAGLPVAVTLGAIGLLWILLVDPVLWRGAAHGAWNMASNDVLSTVPLFVLMGEIIQRTAIANRFYSAVSLWVRWIPGGLIHANIASCAVFSAVCGSSVATAATIGTVAVPNLLRLGYDRQLLFGSLAAGGTLGILIPPSLALIIYSALTEVSLGRLFVGAVLPGIMMALLFHIYIVARAVVGPPVISGNDDETPPATRAERVRSLVDMAPLLALVLFIIVSMYQGWATPTEVAGIAAAMAIVIAIVTGSFTLRAFWEALVRTVLLTSMLMFVVIGAQIFSFAVFSSGLNFVITDWIAALTIGPYPILAMIIVLYVILGMFIDATSMMVLTLALVFPVVVKLGFDPVWFGILLVLLLELGLITPPVGFNLFTIKAISPSTISLNEVTRGAFPFCFIFGLGMLLLILFPQIVLWLPSKMFG